MLKTEARNPNTKNVSKESTRKILELIQEENRVAVSAIDAAIPAIEKSCDLISERMAKGGRLIYIGAGTSGRLGVMDAVECPPTYGVSSELISGIIAGGYDRMFSAAEGAEDSAENGIKDIAAKKLTPFDSVVGISAAGNSAYVAEALLYAKTLGALTVGLTSNEDSRLAREPDVSIITDTGAEVIAGSTRMKAGSAHKMVLNMISTCVMIKAGNVYENLMINLKPSNIKLKARVISIVKEIFECNDEDACKILDKYDWSIKAAVEGEKLSD